MELIESDPSLELQVVVTGAHLMEEFGHTVDAVGSAGFAVSAEVTEITSAETTADVAHQVGAGISGFTTALGSLKPDALVILGDRYEMLAAAVAAFFLDVPIVHLHGGEVTKGAFDDSIRHVITKLSRVHCVAADAYATRVIQLGETPECVHVVGGLGVDQASKLSLMSRNELEADLGLKLRDTILLVTYHPVTAGGHDSGAELSEIMVALESFPDASVIFTMPNADPDHQFIRELIERAVEDHGPPWHAFVSLGQRRYLSLASLATAVIGNSSSGLMEVPSLKTATVNVGERQEGRLVAESVITAAPERGDVSVAITRAMSPEFRSSLDTVVSPYGLPGASEKILGIIKDTDFRSFVAKQFFDVHYSEGRA
jgi:GDP/UDP-N,N'-diacetylbacillosamine 2-epimerase (hydrolysing)